MDFGHVKFCGPQCQVSQVDETGSIELYTAARDVAAYLAIDHEVGAHLQVCGHKAFAQGSDSGRSFDHNSLAIGFVNEEFHQLLTQLSGIGLT